jgi:hypothetical protein
MDTKKFEFSKPDQPHGTTLFIKDWIESIGKQVPDELSQVDKDWADGSIGGRRDLTEYVLGTTRRVPLFEFRNLPFVVVSQWSNFAASAESAVISYHTKYQSRPSKMKRGEDTNMALAPGAVPSLDLTPTGLPRLVRRQNASACPFAISTITSTASSGTPTPTVQYAFTTTFDNGQIEEYASEILTVFDGTYSGSVGAGSSAMLKSPSARPFYSVQVGTKPVNVGTLAPMDVFTSISSALDKLCPTPSGNAPAACEATSTIKIPKIDYMLDDAGDDLNPTGNPLKIGELDVFVPSSNYPSKEIRDKMIVQAALTAAGGMNGSSSCTQHTAKQCLSTSGLLDGECPNNMWHVIFDGTVCNTASFAGVQYSDGIHTGNAAWMDAEWNFALGTNNKFECDEILDVINVAFDVLFPEFIALDTETATTLKAICDTTNEIVGAANGG